MARAKSNEQGRIKSKPAAIDEVTRGIEKLKDLMAQIEDLSREGFPYQDAVRARTELSLRETIRRIFGEKSEEYQTHKGHKLRTSHRAEYVPTVVILKQLVARLEQQKSDLLGVKSAQTDPSATPGRISTPSSLPAVSVPDSSATVADTSIGRTPQPEGAAKTLVAASAIPPSACEPTRAIKEDSQGGSPHRVPGSDAPASRTTAATILNRATASPDPQSIAEQKSNCSQAVSPDDPAALDLSMPTGPVQPEPSISSVAVLTATPTAAEGGALGPASPRPPEAPAAPQPTILVVPIEVAPGPATAAHVVDSEHMPTSPQTRPVSELHHGSTAEPSPVAYPTPVAQTAQANPIDRISAEDSQPAARLFAGMADGRPEVQSPTMNQVSILKPTRGVDGAILPVDDSMAALRKVCTRFHLVARQLRLRRDYRATLEVEDEYDVQDLLYALLRLEFEEVGSEDWRPAYGEGATRTSYLLHKDRVVIVAKKTKSGVTAKELAEQVKMDTSHYSGRIDCRTLVCFIYDPEGRVGNPRGLESDLTMVSDAFTLEVIIAPK
jgi:hypothetical protein